MEQRRGHARRAILVAACAVVTLAVGGTFAGIALTGDSSESAKPLPTTGEWMPLTVKRPAVPIVGGGIPVDIEPMIEREDFVTTIEPLSTGQFHYRMSIWNASNLGTVTSFQWYPPIGSRIVRLLGSTAGRCEVKGLSGFGGAQFPTVVLNPTIVCDQLQLKAPSCTCQGDGGSVAITFVTDKEMNGGSDDARVRAVSLNFERVPTFLGPGTNPSSG